ncbi:MAG: YiiX/YebB-like N1pC/P60 family cysteine hydrolase, partial [Patescibacteria group bacterium]|nr:YiiX/YebB-like N1pC/P60 family cysteine hydrolase [Patescibacteria group bacterium]
MNTLDIGNANLAATRSGKSGRRDWLIVVSILLAMLLVVLAAVAYAFGPACIAYWQYQPREGDVVFQSLPYSRLVRAIEGATRSPYSHCGVVAKRDGRWVVYEAYDGVSATPLREFLFRGRNQGFAVYRLKEDRQQYVPAMLECVQSYLGRPYDVRYRFDDEAIYCSELIFKAYRTATGGEELGTVVKFGDLNWKPFEETVQHYEPGPVPLDREMITPKDLALAPQLELV